jgi:hypothetical protein
MRSNEFPSGPDPANVASGRILSVEKQTTSVLVASKHAPATTRSCVYSGDMGDGLFRQPFPLPITSNVRP